MEQVRAGRPSLKILMTTAYAGSVLVHEGRLAPGVELLKKPFTFAAPASRIRELLDRRAEGQKRNRILSTDEVLIRMLVVDAFDRQGLKVEESWQFPGGARKDQRVWR